MTFWIDDANHRMEFKVGSYQLRNRGSVVIFEGEKIGLIKRIKDGELYYVFPGGGVEEGETPEECAKREAFEELGVTVDIGKCIATVEYGGTQYFFLSKIIDGTFGTGQGVEFTYGSGERGSYLPVWVDLDTLQLLDIRPREAVLKVQLYISNQR